MYNHQEPESESGTVISNNPVVNLTATAASASFLIALFLCFADQRSRTIRRYAVQSVGLGMIWIVFTLVMWIIGALLGVIPFIGGALSLVCWIVVALSALGAAVLRVRMMFGAYRGLAYKLPLIGETLRRFE
ncbi:hypothetical protein FACS18948_0130 [Clostridia bacterium]|nr:hypothetical protein FACS18948_0130 [Clostridia bacterium]